MEDGVDSSSDEHDIAQTAEYKRGNSSAHDINKRFEFSSSNKSDSDNLKM